MVGVKMTTVYFNESHDYEMRINKLALCSYQTILFPTLIVGYILTLNDNKDICLTTIANVDSDYTNMGVRIHTKNKLRNFSGCYIGEVSKDGTDWHVFIENIETMNRFYVEKRKG